jgi:hypothetical protein
MLGPRTQWRPFVAIVLLFGCGGQTTDIEASRSGQPDARVSGDNDAGRIIEHSDGKSVVPTDPNAPYAADFPPCLADAGCEMALCKTDADCRNIYLVCVPQDVYVGQNSQPVTLNLCAPRYQQACTVDADCGPGFTCDTNAGSLCNGSDCKPVTWCDSPYAPCSSSAECLPGWSCYSPPKGGCPSSGCDPYPKACYPPWFLQRFAEQPWSARLAKPVMRRVARLDREFEDPFPPDVHDLDAVVIMLIYHDTV